MYNGLGISFSKQSFTNKLFCNNIKSGSLRILRSLYILLIFELLKERKFIIRIALLYNFPPPGITLFLFAPKSDLHQQGVK